MKRQNTVTVTVQPKTSTRDTDSTELPSSELAAAAYARVSPELERVSDPLRILADIPRIVGIVFRAMPRLRELERHVAKELPNFDRSCIRKLPDYALAALHAHILAVPATSIESPVQPLLAEGLPLRQDLFKAADALAHFGIIDGERIDLLRPGTGHMDAALDLLGLAEIFTERWPDIRNHSCITEQDVARASEIGTQLVTHLGGSDAPTVAAERRAQAYTLLVTAYDQCRRAVTYLRWDEDDLESILPSLFVRQRTGKSKNGAETTEPSPPAPEPPLAPATAQPNGAAQPETAQEAPPPD